MTGEQWGRGLRRANDVVVALLWSGLVIYAVNETTAWERAFYNAENAMQQNVACAMTLVRIVSAYVICRAATSFWRAWRPAVLDVRPMPATPPPLRRDAAQPSVGSAAPVSPPAS